MSKSRSAQSASAQTTATSVEEESESTHNTRTTKGGSSTTEINASKSSIDKSDVVSKKSGNITIKKKGNKESKFVAVSDKVDRTRLTGRKKYSAHHAKSRWSFVNVITKIVNCVITCVGCTCVIFIGSVVPVSCIVVGSLYVNGCRAEPKIPIFLLVFGALTSIWLCSATRVFCDYKKRNPDSKAYNIVYVFDGVINVSLIVWTVLGSIWIFPMDEPNYVNSEADKYCNVILFFFTYTLLCCIYAVLFCALFMCLCMCCWTCCRRK